MKKYVYENSKDNKNSIRLCMQLIKPESKIHYLSSLKIPSNDQLIIVEEIKMNMLAKSCFAPGLIALLSNLTASGDMDSSLFEKDWLRDYVQGLGFEIYRANLNHQFEDFLFKDIVKIIYKEYKSIVFALGIEWQGRSIVILNPSKYRCSNFKQNKYYLFMICEDASIAEEAETLEEMSRESRRKYFGNEEAFKAKSDDEYSDSQRKENENPLGSLIDFDYDIDSKDYFMLSKSQSQMDVTVTTTLQNDSKVKNHIIVWGIHWSIKHFILPLRAKYLQNYQYIVIVSQGSIPLSIWDDIKNFAMILLVNGSPLEQESLLKANVMNADKAVILGHDPTLMSNLHSEMPDAQSIFIFKAIKRLNPELQVTVKSIFYN